MTQKSIRITRKEIAMQDSKTGIRRIQSLNEIPQGSYTGYYWMSDKEKPETVDGEFRPNLNGQNPFIIEAMLWDETTQKSIMITHTGKYHIFEYDLNLLEVEDEIKEYMPHRLEGVKKVKFKQYWKAEDDPLCCDFQVLELKAQIFVGFDE
jgi:CRISPR type III-associated protein (TIGR04423 family)